MSNAPLGKGLLGITGKECCGTAVLQRPQSGYKHWLYAGKKRFTISTGRGALTATALEILPIISRFHPVKPREPRTIASHCLLVAVSRIVVTTSPLDNVAS